MSESTPSFPAPHRCTDPRVVVGLLDRLEDHRDAAGTLPIHDALYDLLRGLREGPCEEVEVAWDRLRSTLASHQAHPLAPAIRQLWEEVPAPVPRSLQDLLASLPGLKLEGDPVVALERYLHDRAEIQHLLEERIDDLAERLQRTALVANALGIAVVVLLLLTCVGWAGAFDLYDLPPPETPALQPEGTARSTTSRDAGGGERR